MDKKNILSELIKHYSDGNKSKFANMLGVSPQAISTWEKRNTFDIELIYAKCENLNASWLLTGVGNMLNTEKKKEQTSGDPIIDRLLGIIAEKDELIRQQAEDIGQLREQIEQLKMRLQKNASNAGTSGIANAG